MLWSKVGRRVPYFPNSSFTPTKTAKLHGTNRQTDQWARSCSRAELRELVFVWRCVLCKFSPENSKNHSCNCCACFRWGHIRNECWWNDFYVEPLLGLEELAESNFFCLHVMWDIFIFQPLLVLGKKFHKQEIFAPKILTLSHGSFFCTKYNNLLIVYCVANVV